MKTKLTFAIAMKNKPFIIGITGGSGSGKTTFIHQLKAAFSEEELCIVSQDDYYKPRTEQKADENGVINFDLPSAINKVEFFGDIEKLISGEVVTREEYTFNNDLAEPKILTFRPAPLIIVEGLFVFHYQEIFQLFDLKIFLDAKDNLKVIRRIKRDRVERNYPLDDVLYRYEHHVMPTFEKYILPYKSEADIIINNNSNFEKGMKVMLGFMKSCI
jgi:uridine kinase